MEKIRVGKQKASKGYAEARGFVVTLVKFATMAVPVGVAVQLGIMDLTRQEVYAVGAAALALGFALLWLHKR